MTTQEKMHTIELTSHELARVLFVMRNANGETHGKRVTSTALEKLGAKDIGFDVLHSKEVELAKRANIPTFIDYYEIQKEWESFLGIGKEVKNQGILGKVISLEAWKESLLN